jgi:hypothetical protein
MTYDVRLADQVRELMKVRASVTEQKMFGGLAFLVDGNMAAAASGRGGLLIRVETAEWARLIATTDAEPMELGGRSMGSGWVHVAPQHVRTTRQLEQWIAIGVSAARSLPPREAKRW